MRVGRVKSLHRPYLVPFPPHIPSIHSPAIAFRTPFPFVFPIFSPLPSLTDMNNDTTVMLCCIAASPNCSITSLRQEAAATFLVVYLLDLVLLLFLLLVQHGFTAQTMICTLNYDPAMYMCMKTWFHQRGKEIGLASRAYILLSHEGTMLYPPICLYHTAVCEAQTDIL